MANPTASEQSHIVSPAGLFIARRILESGEYDVFKKETGYHVATIQPETASIRFHAPGFYRPQILVDLLEFAQAIKSENGFY